MVSFNKKINYKYRILHHAWYLNNHCNCHHIIFIKIYIPFGRRTILIKYKYIQNKKIGLKITHHLEI